MSSNRECWQTRLHLYVGKWSGHSQCWDMWTNVLCSSVNSSVSAIMCGNTPNIVSVTSV